MVSDSSARQVFNLSENPGSVPYAPSPMPTAIILDDRPEVRPVFFAAQLCPVACSLLAASALRPITCVSLPFTAPAVFCAEGFAIQSSINDIQVWDPSQRAQVLHTMPYFPLREMAAAMKNRPTTYLGQVSKIT